MGLWVTENSKFCLMETIAEMQEAPSLLVSVSEKINISKRKIFDVLWLKVN